MYKKRPGTSGIHGQLYETKLISLLFFRAKHDNRIEEFNLATNVDNIGAFDDICFRAKVKGFNRPVAVFIQAKHMNNDKVLTLNNKTELSKYFESYVKIRRAFKTNNEDVMFNGKFDEIESIFVMYTTAQDDHSNHLVLSSFSSNLNDLLSTGNTGLRPSYNTEDVEFLCKIALKEQITTLAAQMARFIYNEIHFKLMLHDELLLQYHVILAQKAMHVSEIQPEGHRVASFRQDFFDTNEEYILLFKDTLFIDILKKRTVDDKDILNYLSIYSQQTFAPFTDIEMLSKLIGSVITYNKIGKLEFINKQTSEVLKRRLDKVYVSQSIVNEAIELAAKTILMSRKFKVPAAFGNKDLKIRGNSGRVERRLNHLTTKITDLLDNSKLNKIVAIDESLEDGFLQLNGGIAGAVGNILIFDEHTKLMKFIDSSEFLGDHAKRLYEKIKNKNHNLDNYRFEIRIKTFPKLSFHWSEHDENYAKDFLSKLLFYSNQADENGVEEILKYEIEDLQPNNTNTFRLQSDAIFLKYHDKIQKWWMLPKKGSYLTKQSKIYESAVKDIVKDPLMSVINIIYKSKIKNYDYAFKEEAVRSLKLNDQLSKTVIITENSELTVTKVIQQFKHEDYVILDLEYVLNLPTNDCKELYTELMHTSKEKRLIFICDKVHNSSRLGKTLENIAKAILDKNTIIISNKTTAVIIKKYFLQLDNIVHDSRNNLIDMSDESQKIILKNALVIFQDKEISLDLIVDDVSTKFVTRDVLNRIVNKETTVIGKSNSNSNYEEIKQLYVDIRVSRGRIPRRDMMRGTISMVNNDKVIGSLYDVVDDVVLITAKPGMGKSTLLTHISLKTKELDPKVWIVRINLLDYSREFSKWQENKTAIDTLETLKFMCQVILSEKQNKLNKVIIALEESDGVVNLKEPVQGDQWSVFELNMFLHFYNTANLIFLFDGFDEICPHYTNEVIKLVKTVRNYPRKHRIWVTSRSYNKIKSILQREFGASYELELFSKTEREHYLEQFWKSNLILNELNSTQLDNVFDFIKMMSEKQETLRSYSISVNKLLNLPLHEIYLNALKYLKNEIKYSHNPMWSENGLNGIINFNTKEYRVRTLMSYNGENLDINNMYEFVGTPLHLYLIADYFQNEIKDVSKKSDKWNFDINTFNIYERFLETKLKNIRFQEKNKIDIYNPDIMMTYDKERADFIVKHKKLAAYAIFHRYNHKLFTRKELKEIKETIKFIKKGGEKTGLIYSIASNNIPVFIHMTFAEYFAVEYLCDYLKNEKCDTKLYLTMDFIFNGMFFRSSANVLNILDTKINMDKELMSVLENNGEDIFGLLLQQIIDDFLEYGDDPFDSDRPTLEIQYETSLKRAVSESLSNFMFLFLSVFKRNVNEDNLTDFIKLVNRKKVFTTAILVKYDELIIFAIDIVRKIDKSKLRLLFDNLSYVPLFNNYDEMSNDDIVKDLRTKVRNRLFIY